LLPAAAARVVVGVYFVGDVVGGALVGLALRRVRRTAMKRSGTRDNAT
jgi:hypothetical protein